MRNSKGQFVKGNIPVWTEERKKKFSENNPMKNEVSRKKVSLAMMGNKNADGVVFSEERRKKISIALTGKKLSDEHKKKLKKPKLNGLSRYWFGTMNEYKVIHRWVAKMFGKPTKCERCLKDGLTSRQIHWANKSKKYLKDRDDWWRLCAKCHAFLDKNKENLC